jgi:glyoxylase-like metal-dependent hydrolase (beta-lactamase superfamily II)
MGSPVSRRDPDIRLGPVEVFTGADAGKYPDGNQVLVRGRDGCVAFDMPCVAHQLGAALDAVDRVILGHVHEDHMAGLCLLPQVPVEVHHADLAAAQSWDGLKRHFGHSDALLEPQRARLEAHFHYRPRPDATGYADGAVWDLGGVRVRAVHMPGHTAGHCVLLVEPQGIAFIGDIDLSGFGPYYGDGTSSLMQFRQTLARVKDLPASVWITSHHKGVIDDRVTFEGLLRAFAWRIEARTQRLLELLGAGPRRLDDLVRERILYRPEQQDWWCDAAERRSITQHLDELLLDGRVLQRGDGSFALAAAAGGSR